MALCLFTPEGWPESVQIASSTRDGGCSDVPYDSFNLARHVGDDPAAVTANRRRLREALPGGCEPFWLTQEHGVGVVPAQRDARFAPTADASWTRHRQLACAVLTADCLPVLLASLDGTVVAAAHAGWRGLAAGIVEATIEAMGASPADLLAWLGPAIGPAAFEVGPEVRAAFVENDDEACRCFVPANRSGHFRADLRGLAGLRLQRLGVDPSAIGGDDRCTYHNATAFYSYRRDGRTGRMVTLILRR